MFTLVIFRWGKRSIISCQSCGVVRYEALLTKTPHQSSD